MLKRILFYVLPLLVLPLQASDSLSLEIVRRLDHLLGDSLLRHSQMAMCVYDISDDTLLFSHNELQLMRPASCQKVVTSVAALTLLGTDHHFSTKLYLDGTQEGTVFKGDVIVRAGFDPLLNSADLEAMISELSKRGITSIQGNLLLDMTMKDTLSRGAGWCWDDDDKLIRPLYLDGKLAFSKPFRNLLRKAEIQFKGRTLSRPLPETAELVAEHRRPIKEVMRPMMKESDNLCAEAVFYQIAALSQKPKASADDAVKLINDFIDEQGLNSKHYRIADGSGLSLYNYATPQLFLKLLRYAYANSKMRRLLFEVLPIAGIDGTLKKRMQLTPAEGNVRAKTGSVTGVSTLAGYCTTAHGHMLCFVIFNQGLVRASHGRAYQDKVLDALTSGWPVVEEPTDIIEEPTDTIQNPAPTDEPVKTEVYNFEE